MEKGGGGGGGVGEGRGWVQYVEGWVGLEVGVSSLFGGLCVCACWDWEGWFIERCEQLWKKDPSGPEVGSLGAFVRLWSVI